MAVVAISTAGLIRQGNCSSRFTTTTLEIDCVIELSSSLIFEFHYTSDD